MIVIRREFVDLLELSRRCKSTLETRGESVEIQDSLRPSL